MNKIIYVAQNSEKILAESAGQPVHCPGCNEEWYSPFDKFYIAAYGKCSSCATPDELEKNSENIFAIIG